MPRKPTPTPHIRMKVCSGCLSRTGTRQSYPATLEFFYRDKHQSDHLSSQCKECRRITARVSRNRNLQPSTVPRRILELSDTPPDEPLPNGIPSGYRRCSNPYCRRIRPESLLFFYSIPKGLRGLSSQCRVCLDISRQQGKRADPSQTGTVSHDPNPYELEDGQDIPAELLDSLESGEAGGGM